VGAMPHRTPTRSKHVCHRRVRQTLLAVIQENTDGILINLQPLICVAGVGITVNVLQNSYNHNCYPACSGSANCKAHCICRSCDVNDTTELVCRAAYSNGGCNHTAHCLAAGSRVGMRCAC
jgi:hypothetical protein